MSSDFTYASTWAPYFLADASELCCADLCSHSIDVGFSLLVDNEGDEKARTGWVPEPNRHRGWGGYPGLAPGHSVQYLIRSQGEGELWSAYSTDVLDIGEPVNIVAVKGIGVVIERADNGHDETGTAKTKLAGTKNNERHCH